MYDCTVSVSYCTASVRVPQLSIIPSIHPFINHFIHLFNISHNLSIYLSIYRLLQDS